jgi:hypothetical protein|tara:strand:- start:2720 stop:3109 length:390 start_codon:yes stop_codon:yes gene_type:complete
MDINIVIDLFEKVGIPVLTAASAGYGLWWLMRWITNTFRQDVLSALKNLHQEIDEEIRDTRTTMDKRLSELNIMVIRLIDRVRILEKNYIEHDETMRAVYDLGAKPKRRLTRHEIIEELKEQIKDAGGD